MGDLKFILGFIAGWIVTTEDGKKTANAVAEKAIGLIDTIAKPGEKTEEKKPES